MTRREWKLDGLRIIAFEGRLRAPVVYAHMSPEDAAALADERWSVAAIDGADWNRDLTPWPAEAAFRGQPDFAGGADAHLKMLTERIVPMVEAELEPEGRALAGYSLAGLFAIYAALKTGMFPAAASVSGSMWYPDFATFAEQGRFVPRCAYFSVGEREKLSRNAAFRSIETCTERVCAALEAHGARTVFELNPGGHFDDHTGRMRRALEWLSANAGA